MVELRWTTPEGTTTKPPASLQRSRLIDYTEGTMPGIFITPADGDLSKTVEAMDRLTNEWEMRAARGECGWLCADCSCSFPEGMPDACTHGYQSCTDTIKRDKANAACPSSTKISNL